jgi:folate-binding protein YgfZ
MNTGFYTAFLNAQGRMLNDCFIYRVKREGIEEKGGGWLVEVDASEVEKLEKHIKRYRLRKKFDIRVLPEDEIGIWSIWGEESGRWKAHSLAGEKIDVGGDIGCEDLRAPGMGRRLLLPGNKKPEVEMEESTEDSYTIRRYLKGVPEGQSELLREHALPQESCVDFMGGIDYDKGCYLGQELTIRTHHQGVVRKRILPVMVYGAEESEPTGLEYDPETASNAQNIPRETSIDPFERRGRSAGKFLGGIGNIGLGLCRLEMMTDVKIPGGTAGYKEGDEFKLKWEVEESSPEMFKVKAFVPAWHLTQQGTASQQ